jgi:hypothetical protein
MPKGLKIPLQASPSGGAATVTGDENDAKIIRLALSDDDNENAFQQDIALGEGMIFNTDNPDTKTWINQRIVKIFERFEAQKRFRLFEDSIVWDEDNSGDGKVMLRFKYLNLESDKEREYEQQIGSGV